MWALQWQSILGPQLEWGKLSTLVLGIWLVHSHSVEDPRAAKGGVINTFTPKYLFGLLFRAHCFVSVQQLLLREGNPEMLSGAFAHQL